MATETITKICPSCSKPKTLNEFYKDESKVLSVTTYCKDCSDSKRQLYPNSYWRNNKTTAKAKYASLRGNCPQRNISFKLREEEFISWFESQPKLCFYCGRPLVRFKRGNDGLTVDRLDNHIGYQIDNIILCCWRCNLIKGYWFTSTEMLEIANKYLKGREITK